MSSEFKHNNEVTEVQNAAKHLEAELNQQEVQNTLDKVLDFKEVPVAYESPKISQISFGSSVTA